MGDTVVVLDGPYDAPVAHLVTVVGITASQVLTDPDAHPVAVWELYSCSPAAGLPAIGAWPTSPPIPALFERSHDVVQRDAPHFYRPSATTEEPTP